MNYAEAAKEDSKRQTENWPTIGTIQYLGSKSRILSNICPKLAGLENIDTFVDLFAGTGSVAFALQDVFKIYANDLQYYAYIINEAVLNGTWFDREEEAVFFKNIYRSYEALVSTVRDAIEAEESFLEADSIICEEYQAFSDGSPHVFRPNTPIKELESLARLCQGVEVGHPFGGGQEDDLPVLFLTYYSNTYFGIRQCCEIDAIRGAIASLSRESQQHVLLTALMSVMSVAVSATTHFAQFLKARDQNSCEFLAQKRSMSIIELFKKKIDIFRKQDLLSQRVRRAVCGNQDYLEFLNKAPLSENTLVYADPPYFKEHYSRYYHVLETLCLYDYPKVTFNPRLKDYTVGRYRDDRAVSPFGKKKLALDAFRSLIETCAEGNSCLAISYSDNSIVECNSILETLDEYFYVSSQLIPLSHSKQGRKSISEVNEVLVIARPRSRRPSIGQKQVERVLHKLESKTPLYDNPASAMHNYMARKPYNIINTIIAGLLSERGIVLDPMAGSGTTLMESRKNGHSSVGVDISEQAALIMRVSLKAWDLGLVNDELASFLEAAKDSLEKLYEFDIDGEKRIIERCHFDRHGEELVPISYWYKQVLDSGQLSPRKKDVVDDAFLHNYSVIAAEAEGLYQDRELLENSRIAVKKGATVSDYLCPRNRLAVAAILDVYEKYKHTYSSQIVELVISSALNLMKLSDKKASSQMPYWRPTRNITSRNAMWILDKKAALVLDGLDFLSIECPGDLISSFGELGKRNNSLVVRCPIQCVSRVLLPDNSIDLVVTDPPYTDQIPYLEYSQLWASLLGWDNLEPGILADEIVVSNAARRTDKNQENFDYQMKRMLQRVADAMKPFSHMALFFHDFSLQAWSGLIKSAQEGGLAYQGQVSIGRQRRSFKTVLSPNKTLDGNYLVIFRKRNLHAPFFDGDLDAAVKRCIYAATGIVRQNRGKATSQELYDKGLLRDSIESGSLHLLAEHYKTFLEVVKGSLTYEEGYWSEH